MSSQVSLTYEGNQVQIKTDGRVLGTLPAHSPLLIPAGQLAEEHPGLAGSVWRAALLVAAGDVEIVEGPHNILNGQNVTGRVGKGGGRQFTIRVIPGNEALVYDRYCIEVCNCPPFGAGEMLGEMICEHTLALRLARRIRFEAEELAGLGGWEHSHVGRWASNLIERRPGLEHQARRALAIVVSDLVETDPEPLFSLRLQTTVYDPMIFARYNVTGDGRRWSCTCAAGSPCAHTLATMWTQRIVRAEQSVNGTIPGDLVNRLGTTRRQRLVRSVIT